VAGFLALDEAPVERLTDKGVRHLDARAAVVDMQVAPREAAPCEAAPGEPATAGRPATTAGSWRDAILRMIILHTAPAVRPEDVLTVLRDRGGIVPSAPPATTRLAQGPRALLTGTGGS
ncbi:MAG: radical SAM protein, partial [Actinobacteria bacterium]|nr:radical SAM protein [Actinomycetota bacterium]